MALGGVPRAKQQLGLDQPGERVLQHLIGQPGDRRQQFVGKLAADRGADLQHLARRAEPVDARHQRGLQRGRNGELLHRLVELFALEHRLGQFLDEQRHAVGALDDLLEQRLRQRLAAGDVLDHRHALAPAEAVERHGGDVRLARPGRLEVGAEGDEQQDRQASAGARR